MLCICNVVVIQFVRFVEEQSLATNRSEKPSLNGQSTSLVNHRTLGSNLITFIGGRKIIRSNCSCALQKIPCHVTNIVKDISATQQEICVQVFRCDVSCGSKTREVFQLLIAPFFLYNLPLLGFCYFPFFAINPVWTKVQNSEFLQIEILL